MTEETAVQDTNATAPTEGAAPAAAAEPTIADIMAFDPFGPSDKGEPAPESGKPATEAKGETETGETEPKPADATAAADVAPASKPADAQPAPVTPPTPSPEVQALQQQIATLTQTIQSMSTAQPAPAAKPDGTEATEPKFNLALPPQMIKALRSEDEGEFGAAMTAVINGIANKMWNEVQQHIATEVVPNMGRIADQHYQVVQQRQRVQQEFYGAYPTLNRPELYGIVQQAGVMVAQQRAALNKPVVWDQQFASEIAEKVFAIFPQLKPQAAPQVTPTPKQPFQTTPGTRPTPSSAEAQTKEIMDVIGF